MMFESFLRLYATGSSPCPQTPHSLSVAPQISISKHIRSGMTDASFDQLAVIDYQRELYFRVS